MMEELQAALAERGIDNPEALVRDYSVEVLEDSMAHWDEKRKRGPVGPGLLVKIIRAGGPPKTQAKTRTFEMWAEYVRKELPDIVEAWPYGAYVLAGYADHMAAGGWEVTPDALRRSYERVWLAHVEASS